MPPLCQPILKSHSVRSLAFDKFIRLSIGVKVWNLGTTDVSTDAVLSRAELCRQAGAILESVTYVAEAVEGVVVAALNAELTNVLASLRKYCLFNI